MNLQVLGHLEYITQEGDQYDMLALQAYNNERMASLIIEANPDYSDVIIFRAGVQLRLPIVEQAQSTESLPPWRRTS